MNQLQQTLNIVQIVAFLASFTALASRLFEASRPIWGRLPAWTQTLLPALVPAVAALAQGLTGVKSWSDLSVLFMVCFAMLLPGLPSNRSAAPLQGTKPQSVSRTPSAGDVAVASAIANGTIKPKASSAAPFAACLCVALLALLPGCGLFAVAAPYLAQAAVLLSDASNAVGAAESTHLIDPDLIARARAALAAAAAADNGATDLTAEQLDASLADFRAAWVDIQRVYATKRIGAAQGGIGLPVPLAVRRSYK
jgi:hypothetical protein